MKKASAITDSVTIVGIIAISALMFAKVPGMVDDIKEILSKESVRAKSVEIANLLTLTSSSPNDIEIIYKLPSKIPYVVTVRDGNVTVEAGGDRAVAKTLSKIKFGPEFSHSLSITKTGIRSE